MSPLKFRARPDPRHGEAAAMTYLKQSSLDCAAELRADILNDNVAHALLALEDEGHQAGWDHPLNAPAIFHLNANPETARIRAAFSSDLTTAFTVIAAPYPPDQTGLALLNLAARLHVAISNGTRLDTPPWPLHGYGIRMELHTAANEPFARKAHQEGRLREYPTAHEARAITFVDVNGYVWWLVRLRGKEVELGAGKRTDNAAPFSFAHALDAMIAAALQRPFPQR